MSPNQPLQWTGPAVGCMQASWRVFAGPATERCCVMRRNGRMSDNALLDSSQDTSSAKAVSGARRRWPLFLSLLLSLPVLTLCFLLPIRRGEAVYRFLLQFRDKYAGHQWTTIVACRWVAWATLVLALVQVGILVALFVRPRRPLLIVSYVGVVLLAALFMVWAYYMASSASLMDGMRRPA